MSAMTTCLAPGAEVLTPPVNVEIGISHNDSSESQPDPPINVMNGFSHNDSSESQPDKLDNSLEGAPSSANRLVNRSGGVSMHGMDGGQNSRNE
jgi:hypothetical protein